jgi:uncharacterized protein YyaL (SSP411 family)
MTDYLELARQTQRFTFARLAYLGEALDCESASYLSYRRSDKEPEWSDQWYNATQLGADAALLAADPSFGDCTIARAAEFMTRYWDSRAGGYLGRGRPDGSLILGPDRYSDDNAHTGLVLLDAYEATGERRYFEMATGVADWLSGSTSTLSDEVFGGGLWWNTRHGDSPEGKPTLSQALSIQLFARLFGITGQPRWRTSSLRLDAWTDENLYDREAGLYRWSVSYAECAARAGRIAAERFFGYDQGCMIEAKLALFRSVEADSDHLRRAQLLAEQLEPTFWHRPEGGFNLEHGIEQVYSIYASWLTPSLLALLRVDGDQRWLDLARRNVDALNSYLRAQEGGYYKAAYLRNGAWRIDRTRDTTGNSGMQRAQALLGAVVASQNQHSF